jgi:polyisoprenoid-binding protein YceI
MSRWRWSLLVAVATAAASAQSGRAFVLESGTLAYRVVHKFHQVEGTTHELEGRAVISADGTARVQVRARVASFDSGNSNRDEHMREATHEPAHPNVELKGRLPPVTLPLKGEEQVTLEGTVELNGIVRPQSIPVTLRPQGSGVEALFSFPISLDAYDVERPELLLIKIDDKCVIDGDLVFAEPK